MVKISVVMSVFNGAEHLAESIESILAQTERDFELIAVDDGSIDGSSELLARYASKDSRVKPLRQANAGLTRALIAGCALASAPLIARHDADDVSAPDRFARQAALFDRSPQLAFISCAVDFIGPRNEFLYRSYEGPAYEPTWILTDDGPLDGPSAHGSVMFRRDVYEQAGGYRPEFYFGQDWDLWYRLAELGPFARCRETLYSARVTPGSISVTSRKHQFQIAQCSTAAWEARRRGDSEAAALEEASGLRPPMVKKRSRRAFSDGLYFIGEALRRNRDPRARQYLVDALREWPFSFRTWVRLAQSLRL